MNSSRVTDVNLEDAKVIPSVPESGSSFFFTSQGKPLELKDTFKEASAFLIAAGPSFAELDRELLRKVWTMTVNNACSTYRGSANCVVDDPSRFNLSTWLDPLIMKFVPIGHFQQQLWDNRLLSTNGISQQRWEPASWKVRDCPNVVGFRRNERFDAANWLTESTINWGNDTRLGGGRSVLLAALRILYLLGFRTVYLLGVDFDMSPLRRYHFAEDRPITAVRGNLNTYARLRQWMKELQPRYLEAGFIVKNCNPASRLDAFPFISYQDALAEATIALGKHSLEQTTGMYRPFESKLEDKGGGVFSHPPGPSTIT